MTSPMTPPTAKGLKVGAKGLRPLANSPEVNKTAPAATTGHIRNLQRRDGSLPSGNSSKTQGMRVATTTHPTHAPTKRTRLRASSDPAPTVMAKV